MARSLVLDFPVQFASPILGTKKLFSGGIVSFPFKTSDGGTSENNLGLNGRALDYRSESPDFRSHW